MVVVGGPSSDNRVARPVTASPRVTQGRNNNYNGQGKQSPGGQDLNPGTKTEKGGGMCLLCDNKAKMQGPDELKLSANNYLTIFPVDHLAAVNVFFRFK